MRHLNLILLTPLENFQKRQGHRQTQQAKHFVTFEKYRGILKKFSFYMPYPFKRSPIMDLNNFLSVVALSNVCLFAKAPTSLALSIHTIWFQTDRCLPRFFCLTYVLWVSNSLSRLSLVCIQENFSYLFPLLSISDLFASVFPFRFLCC